MSDEAKHLLNDMFDRIEHVDKMLCGGLTKGGCIFLSTPKSMDIQTLKSIRKMISEHIKELKDNDATYLHEI